MTKLNTVTVVFTEEEIARMLLEKAEAPAKNRVSIDYDDGQMVSITITYLQKDES